MRAHDTPISPTSSVAGESSGLVRAGIDLGTSSIKMVVLNELDEVIIREHVETPWLNGRGGTAEMSAESLAEALRTLIRLVSESLSSIGITRIDALGIAGMGETGMLVMADGQAVAPAMAWFDPRGAEQVEALPARVAQEFSGRTGLPLGAQVSVAKIAYLRDNGITLKGTQWLNLPEFVATLFGGDRALEYSLTSRTGLLDQDTAAPWDLMMDALGMDHSFFPPLRHGGDSWGHASGEFGQALEGAQLSVAGHDHLVAAHLSETLTSGSYFVSMGTAEVLLRVIDEPLGFDARQRLADALINEVHYVVPGKRVVVAGLKTGLVLGRALRLVGVSDRAGRDRIDRALAQHDWSTFMPDHNLRVSGARNDDGMLKLAVSSDDADPHDLIAAVIHHSNQEVLALIDALDHELTPPTQTFLSGGWAGMDALQRARAAILPNVTVLPESQETAVGAAMATKPSWASLDFSTTTKSATQERQNTA